MKRLIQIFGVLDFVSLIRYGLTTRMGFNLAAEEFPIMTILCVGLIASFVFSSYFLLKMHRLGFWITYFQFPLRIAFLMLSLGFLTELSHLFGSGWYQPILWSAACFEILRLIITISFHRKRAFIENRPVKI